MNGEGGNIGPDLTHIGTRFSQKDILVHTLNPNKEISDQYAATILVMNDGSSIVGRLVNEENGKYFVSQNPFMPQSLREVPVSEVKSKSVSGVSIMLPWLTDRLNADELKDLVAYMVSGGNENHQVFTKK